MMEYGYYFLSYPDNFPSGVQDTNNAASEMYVEVRDIEKNESATYSFNVYTLRFIEETYFRNGRNFFIGTSVIIVKEFTEKNIETAIESILPEIEKYGIDQG